MLASASSLFRPSVGSPSTPGTGRTPALPAPHSRTPPSHLYSETLLTSESANSARHTGCDCPMDNAGNSVRNRAGALQKRTASLQLHTRPRRGSGEAGGVCSSLGGLPAHHLCGDPHAGPGQSPHPLTGGMTTRSVSTALRITPRTTAIHILFTTAS